MDVKRKKVNKKLTLGDYEILKSKSPNVALLEQLVAISMFLASESGFTLEKQSTYGAIAKQSLINAFSKDPMVRKALEALRDSQNN